jgi:hypothetical protein
MRLVSGAQLHVRGTASLGDWVYVRDSVIEGPAPDLEETTIEI